MTIPISFTGNLTADPELKYLPTGVAVASFTVAVSKRVKDGDGWKDGPTSFVRCTVWRQYAENVAESLAKGTKVVVIGSMAQREYETKEGEKRSVWECQVEDVGPALRNATASVRRIERSRADTQPPSDDLWNTDATPF